ncbi:TPA: zinc ribbon domain-containing protein, partial [Candidatus Galligastranaerophilus gallistercoris]|nr:zinc ribbon domain-containing protein [Candidatus Galligastranaerophilus gallistercoris]
MKCPKCKTEVSSKDVFCPGCNLRLIIECPKCKNKVRLGSASCKNCGYVFV